VTAVGGSVKITGMLVSANTGPGRGTARPSRRNTTRTAACSTVEVIATPAPALDHRDAGRPRTSRSSGFARIEAKLGGIPISAFDRNAAADHARDQMPNRRRIRG